MGLTKKKIQHKNVLFFRLAGDHFVTALSLVAFKLTSHPEGEQHCHDKVHDQYADRLMKT